MGKLIKLETKQQRNHRWGRELTQKLAQSQHLSVSDREQMVIANLKRLGVIK